MAFSADSLREPFFDQTVARLRRFSLGEFETNAEELLKAGNQVPLIVPSGLIFHISRCGSTLIANALRVAAGARVLAEATPIAYLLGPYLSAVWPVALEEWQSSRAELLRAVVNLYGQGGPGNSPRVVIKFSSVGILSMDFIRSVWPSVPTLIVVRDPVEVIVSNLQAPGSWMRMKSVPLRACDTFGLAAGDVVSMSPEEYAARIVGGFCQAAAPSIDSNTAVVDYAAINDVTLRKIAQLFGLDLLPAGSPVLQRTLETQAKDARNWIPFRDDRNRKQFAATSRLRLEVDRWAREPYNALEARSIR
jgi:hypothetical protein